MKKKRMIEIYRIWAHRHPIECVLVISLGDGAFLSLTLQSSMLAINGIWVLGGGGSFTLSGLGSRKGASMGLGGNNKALLVRCCKD